MKTRFLGFFVCFVLLVLSCKTGGVTGRLDEVLMPEVKRWGGNPEVQGNAPPVPAHWTVKRDRFGTVLHTADLNFEQVNGFLAQAFGAPSKGGMTADHHQQWVIPAKAAGVSIWYSEADDGVRITVLKPLNVPE